MAPQQQNSTFIDDDNLDTCPSLLNLPESPILPTKHQQRGQNQDSKNNHYNNKKKNKAHLYNKQAENAYEERLVDGNVKMNVQQQTPLARSCKYKHGTANGSSHTAATTAAAARRHRSISLYGVNSTVEQGHKEIPIWLDDEEPRYVSGVTNKTTCNDIIKALIDDELRNGNAHIYCNNYNSNNNNKNDGGHGFDAASRDYDDYVITESWRGIERSYDGNMAILPVWRAWSRVHNEIRLSLKQRRQLHGPLPMRLVEEKHKPSATNFSMFQWLKKLFRLSKTAKKANLPSKPIAKVPQKIFQHESCVKPMAVLQPDQLYKEKQERVQALTPNPSSKTQLYKLAETRATVRRRRRHRREQMRSTHAPVISNCNKNNHNNISNRDLNCIRRRRKDAPLRSSVRNKLAAMHAEINARYEREYTLTRQLSQKCKLFRLQNERYTTKEMEESVGQLQRNIEAYAEDIVKTEHELLELKNEIKQDISMLNNLKRMTLDETTDVKGVVKTDPDDKATTKQKPITQAAKINDMQFVDNIYEFCDNNASMLV
ncbi:inner centromere protein A [Scaptodrosophila lebanonensis]|uniref:Inner centromere protein A n=1 Tax=Drosophila lebanonensis TaxID=7225 RepID=A0A6J2UGC0_DROLE|nr:inner centromere protein A [Scaptodrosophila lebanonensis]